MRKLLIAALVSLSCFAQAETSIMYSKEVTASAEQIKALQKTLMSVPSNDAKVNAVELNKKLQELGLPLLDVNSPTLSESPSELNGFGGPIPVGGQMTDGKHTYCLPCIEGWNGQRFGIYETPSEKEIFDANKKAVTKMLGQCKYDLNRTFVSKVSGNACGDKLVSICTMTAVCDEAPPKANVNATCVAPNGRCPVDPADCIAARSIVAERRGEDAIGDKGFPQKASEVIKDPVAK